MKIRFITVDVFTSQKFGGNPLAVIPEAEGLTTLQMQNIAMEFNLSETTFVFPPKDPAHTAEVRIFTPQSEVPFAGHPNIGTAFVLASHGRNAGDILQFEEKAGLVEIRVSRNGDGTVAGARLTAPQVFSRGDDLPVDLIAEACSLDAENIETANHFPCLASCGMPFLFAELKNREALSTASPRTEFFKKHFPTTLASGIHLYVPTPGDPEVDFQSRMFAPLFGVPEDPATGSANVALIGLLASLHSDQELALSHSIGQGVDMGRPSVMKAEADKVGGVVQATRIGGRCVTMLEGTLELD